MNYRLLKAKVVKTNNTYDDNHLMVHTKTNKYDYSVAINTKSNLAISHLHYCIKKYNKLPSFIPDTDLGLFIINPIHYFKDKIVNKEEFVCCEKKKMLDLEKLILESEFIIALGEVWKSENKNIPFGFTPDKGMHDIHANDNMEDGLLCIKHHSSYIVVFLYFEKI